MSPESSPESSPFIIIHETMGGWNISEGVQIFQRILGRGSKYSVTYPAKFQIHYKVGNVSYCKFANIFPRQNSEKIDSPKFYPTKNFRYTVASCTVSQLKL